MATGSAPSTDPVPTTVDAGKMPRWVKVFILVGALLLIGFVLLHLAGLAPTGHGP